MAGVSRAGDVLPRVRVAVGAWIQVRDRRERVEMSVHQDRRQSHRHIHEEFVDLRESPSATYEFLRLADGLPAFGRYKRAMRPLLEPRPGEVLLDVGCGVGFEACRWAAEYPDVDVVGLDRPLMIDAAARLSAETGVSVRWVPGDAEKLPFEDDTIDAAYAEKVLMYVPEPAQAIAELVRVLRPGGRLALFELDQESTALDGDPAFTAPVVGRLCASVSQSRMGRQLPQLLRAVGLEHIRFEPFTFQPPWEIQERIVNDVVRLGVAQRELDATAAVAWLTTQHQAARAGLFTTAFTGWLVSGRVPGP